MLKNSFSYWVIAFDIASLFAPAIIVAIAAVLRRPPRVAVR